MPVNSPSAGESGLTLIEIVVTIALIGLLASVTGPALARPDATTRTIADVSAGLRRAASTSARLGVPVVVTVDVPAGTIRTEAQGMRFDEAVAIVAAAGSRGRVRFLPNGRASGDSIWIRDSPDESGGTAVFVTPWNGRVVVGGP